MDSGLEGLVVARTALSDVDGELGRLVVRGQTLQDLAGGVGFEAMAALLWGDLGGQALSPEDVRLALGAARTTAFTQLERVLPTAAAVGPVAGLRLCLAALERPGATADWAERLPADLVGPVLATAAIPVAIAAMRRESCGLEPVRPDPQGAHVADFLRMLRGAPASPPEEVALETYLVTVAEHGMNASTFTARVVASTRAGALCTVLAAYCALVGPLHGGAPGPVLDMLDAIGTEDRAEVWLAQELACGHRLMGFGHRLYRTRDPRADVLKSAIAKLRGDLAVVGSARSQDGSAAGAARLGLAQSVERMALAALASHRPDRRLDTNVEFYTAVLLEALWFERTEFTPLFAAGRVLGWCAHALEQELTGRLIRPASQYVGPMPGDRVRAG